MTIYPTKILTSPGSVAGVRGHMIKFWLLRSMVGRPLGKVPKITLLNRQVTALTFPVFSYLGCRHDDWSYAVTL